MDSGYAFDLKPSSLVASMPYPTSHPGSDLGPRAADSGMLRDKLAQKQSDYGCTGRSLMDSDQYGKPGSTRADRFDGPNFHSDHAPLSTNKA